MFDRNLNANGTVGVTGSSQTGRENPADANSKPLESVFANLTSYKNRNGAIWGRGEMHVFKNVKLADSAMDFTHASGEFGRLPFTSKVVDSLFVGETENIGNPTTASEKAYGRSLPKPELPDYPIRGYEYYDYRHDIENTTFVNFEDNATRKSGAISNLLFSSFGVSTNNAFERVKFEKAKPVYFPPMEGNRKWASDNGGSSSFKTAAYKDKDGSLGMGPNSYVLIHDGVNNSVAVDAVDGTCRIEPTWNAAVCKGDVGRLTINNGAAGGGGGGRGGPGGGAGAGGGAGRGGAPGGGAGRGGPGAGGAPRGAAPGGNNFVAQGPGGGAPRGGAPGAGGAGRGGPGGGAPGGAGRGGPGGGAPGGAGRGGPGGGAPGGAQGGGAAQQPLVLIQRNGKEFPYTAVTNIRGGTELKVATERPTVGFSIAEMDKGSWVIFELPGFTSAASGTAVESLDALRSATATSYYKGTGALWVKLVSNGDQIAPPSPPTTLTVNR
jgi:hypothetical protein